MLYALQCTYTTLDRHLDATAGSATSLTAAVQPASALMFCMTGRTFVSRGSALRRAAQAHPDAIQTFWMHTSLWDNCLIV